MKRRTREQPRGAARGTRVGNEIMLDAHEHILDQVDDYVHQLLGQDQASAVEAHCAQCETCREELALAQQRKADLDALPQVEASEQLIADTLKHLDGYVTHRANVAWYLGRIVAWSTIAAVLLIGAFHGWFLWIQPSPYDLRMLGQNQLLPGAVAVVRVGVINGRNGQPIAGIPLQLTLLRDGSEPLELAQVTSNEQHAQAVRLQIPELPDGKNYVLQMSANLPGSPEVIEQQLTIRRQWKLMVATDKPVYRPGQRIQIRSLSLRRPHNKPLPGESVTFSVHDPAGNVIFRERVLTSKFGICATECPLAAGEIAEGDYRIECVMKDVVSTRTVRVQKYVLPKFKIALDFDQPFYQPSQRVQGTIEADYFFGKPVAAADMEISIWNMAAPPSRLGQLKRQADAEGKATFVWEVPRELVGTPSRQGNTELTFIATVTDTAGQQQQQVARRMISTRPIQIQIIPQAQKLLLNQPNVIYVQTRYPDGRPAVTELQVENQKDAIPTNKLGVAEFEITPSKSTVDLVVQARDANGRSGRRHVRLECGEFVDDFIVTTDQAIYRAGDTLQLDIRCGGSEPVFVDLVKDGQSIAAETVRPENGTGRLDFDLPTYLSGPLQVSAFRFNQSGVAVRRSQVLLVQQPNDLTVQAKLPEQPPRPGEQVRVEFSVVDSQGQPAPGALSVAMVDEAVYSVKQAYAGVERQMMTLQEELLKPVATIYDVTQLQQAAGQEADPDRELLARAMLASAAVASGGRVVPVRFNAIAEQALLPVPHDALHNLAATSYLGKQDRFERYREQCLFFVVMAWGAFAVTLVGVGTGSWAYFYPRVFGLVCSVLLTVLLLGGTLCGLVAVSFYSMDSQWASFGAASAAMDMAMPTESPMAEMKQSAQLQPPRLREWFPETLVWQPELITDDQGRATLEVTSADSITNWKLAASAVTLEGRLGSEVFDVPVFQPFFVDLNLPVAFTRNDQATVPVVVYNYLDQPQTVELQLAEADWFEVLGEAAERPADPAENADAADAADAAKNDDADDANAGETNGWHQTLELQAGEVRQIGLPLKLLKVGKHSIELSARAGEVADAIRREVEVLADGRRVETIASGQLSRPFATELNVPEDIIPGSASAVVTLYPSTFSHVVEGLDAIFRMPSGCFEQTSSTTYPNVMALRYLQQHQLASPSVEAKARQFIHLGYQRLLTFETATGGFDWYGQAPGDAALTAYGLMEFEDMAQVHPQVDQRVLDRTRHWLSAQRNGNGSWTPSRRVLQSIGGGRQDPALATTAYITWAMYRNQPGGGDGRTRNYLTLQSAKSMDDPYTLALVILALQAIEPGSAAANDYIKRLDELKQVDEESDEVWWDNAEGQRTLFFGHGTAGSVEATALAALALLQSQQHPGSVRGALNWLLTKKDRRGTWHSTQATVVALQALLLADASGLGKEEARRVELALNGKPLRTVEFGPEQHDVVQRIDLSDSLGGVQRLELVDQTKSAVGYRLDFHYHVEGEPLPPEVESPLELTVEYDRTRLVVDDTLTATVRVANRSSKVLPMVMLDLPIPPGFALEPGELDELVGSNTIARYELTPRQAILYLLEVGGEQETVVRYRLRATMPVRVQVPDGQAYEYYNPDGRVRAGGVQLQVRDA